MAIVQAAAWRMPDFMMLSRKRWRGLACAVTVVCFMVLTSVAASHLHIGQDTDAGCAVCTAVAGKLTSAPPAPVPILGVATVAWLTVAVTSIRFIASAGVVLPPGRGPPIPNA